MEEIFALVKARSNNNIDGIVRLLKDDMLNNSGEMEAYVRTLFKSRDGIEYDQFRAAMCKFSKKYGTTMDAITEKLMQKAPPVLRQFNSDRSIVRPVRRSTNSTETETELSNETFFHGTKSSK